MFIFDREIRRFISSFVDSPELLRREERDEWSAFLIDTRIRSTTLIDRLQFDLGNRVRSCLKESQVSQDDNGLEKVRTSNLLKKWSRFSEFVIFAAPKSEFQNLEILPRFQDFYSICFQYFNLFSPQFIFLINF